MQHVGSGITMAAGLLCAAYQSVHGSAIIGMIHLLIAAFVAIGLGVYETKKGGS